MQIFNVLKDIFNSIIPALLIVMFFTIFAIYFAHEECKSDNKIGEVL